MGATVPKHQQSWVKVNAQVDSRMVELVELLNSVPHLQTLDSCEGDPNRAESFVYFYLDDWSAICSFVFGTLAEALRGIEGFSVSVQVSNDSEPMGKLSFRAENLSQVSSALRGALVTRTCGCFHGRGCTALRS